MRSRPLSRARRLAHAAAATLLAGAACSEPDRSAELAAAPPADEAVGLSDALAAGRNVVVIVIDTLRADRLPMYGCERDNAPFLGALAERSVVFERAWAASSWTAPSTASIFTSMYPNEHGVTMGLKVFTGLLDDGEGMELNRIPDHVDTLPSFFQDLGYRTYGLADNPNIAARLGFERGFDRFVNLPRDKKLRDADKMNAQLREWAPEIRASEAPFFLYLHYMDPHAPYHRREPWVDPSAPIPDDPKEDLAAYDSEIRFVDEHIREAFELLGLEENALVVVTSDHGQEFRDHGGTGHRFTLYGELTWVPMIIHLSGADGPRGRIRRNVSNMDILPTLRELMGRPPSQQDHGRSLVDSLWEETAERSIFSMRTNHKVEEKYEKRSIVHGGFKLILTDPGGQVELYDLAADPGEHENLARAQPEVVAALRRRIELQEKAAAGFVHASAGAFIPSAEEAELLAELGYVDDGHDDPDE